MNRLPSVAFVYDRKKNASPDHAVAVELRVTYKGKRTYMSTGIPLYPKEWRNGMVVGRTDANELNSLLSKFRQQVLRIIEQMADENNFSLSEISARIEASQHSEMSFYDFCTERAKVRTYGRSPDSKQRYERFLRFFFKWGKIRHFADITDTNILLMDEELRKRNMKPYSKWNNYHRFLNSFILDAMEAGYIKRNPYKWVNIEKDKTSKSLHKFVTLEELDRIMNAKMPTESLDNVRDVFVFQCFTCLSYKDLKNFDITLAHKSRDRMVYTSDRKKTGKRFTFLILKPAMKILKKYHGKLPVISNVKYNEYLKVVAQAAGVDKPLTTHWARHTGATILLNEGVDMETVARILGHSSTRITRSTYASLTEDTVVKKMEEFEKKLEKEEKTQSGKKNENRSTVSK